MAISSDSLYSDSRGVGLTAPSSVAAENYENALNAFLNYETVAGGLIKEVLAAQPGVFMASILRGYMTLMVEGKATRNRVAKSIETIELGASDATGRERLHLDALARWSQGNPIGAAQFWEQILVLEPLDLLALKMHHYTTFWTGRADILRTTIESILPFWNDSIAGYDHVLGMHAFALNECGRYEEAERIGREAVERNGEDLWSIHAVAHALEMQGAIAAGNQWFEGRDQQWESKNPFQGHLWWHAALFCYGAGDYEAALRVYDDIMVPLSSDFFLDIQNRASLLERFALAGVDVGERWDELGQYAANRVDDHVLAFTDAHCCLALARTSRTEDLERYVSSMEAHSSDLGRSNIDRRGYEVSVQIGTALQSLVGGDIDSAADILMSIRHDLSPIGGSLAQQDLFDLILVDTVERAGRTDLARSLMASRLGKWPQHQPTIARASRFLGGNPVSSGSV